jgi:hypothetical protein
MKSFVHSEDAITMLFRLAESWFDQTLSDGGPRYAEYHPEYIIVEPWNAFSSVFMMIPAIIFFLKLRKDLASMPFMGFSVLMIFLGGLGSTLFHAFRMSEFFLMLDIIPSAILTIALAVYFWLKVLPKWWHILLIFIPVFGLRFLLFRNLPLHIGINLSYAFSGLLIIVPLLIVLYKTNMQQWLSVVLALLSFGLALLFRQLDAHQWVFLPQGTHFLWHLFSAIGSWFILSYLLFIQASFEKIKFQEKAISQKEI